MRVLSFRRTFRRLFSFASMGISRVAGRGIRRRNRAFKQRRDSFNCWRLDSEQLEPKKVFAVIGTPSLAPGADDGISDSDNYISDTTPEIQFVVPSTLASGPNPIQPGDVINVTNRDTGATVYSIPAASVGTFDAGGNFTGSTVTANITSPLPGGNPGSANLATEHNGDLSANLTLQVDTVAPAAPTVAISGAISGTANETEATNLTLGAANITGEAGATISYTITGTAGSISGTKTGIGTPQNITLSSAQLDTLGDGTITFSATATDKAGNPSATAGTDSFTLDTTAPAAPALNVSDDGGALTSPSDTNDNTLRIQGTAEAGSNVAVYLHHSTLGTKGAFVGNATATLGGGWDLNPTSPITPDGTYVLRAYATDDVGNEGPASNPFTITLDTAAPAAPVITTIEDDVAPATGTIADDGNSNDNKLTLAGTAEANSTVEIFSNGISRGLTTADASKLWSYTTPALAEGGRGV